MYKTEYFSPKTKNMVNNHHEKSHVIIQIIYSCLELVTVCQAMWFDERFFPIIGYDIKT